MLGSTVYVPPHFSSVTDESPLAVCRSTNNLNDDENVGRSLWLNWVPRLFLATHRRRRANSLLALYVGVIVVVRSLLRTTKNVFFLHHSFCVFFLTLNSKNYPVGLLFPQRYIFFSTSFFFTPVALISFSVFVNINGQCNDNDRRRRFHRLIEFRRIVTTLAFECS